MLFLQFGSINIQKLHDYYTFSTIYLTIYCEIGRKSVIYIGVYLMSVSDKNFIYIDKSGGRSRN